MLEPVEPWTKNPAATESCARANGRASFLRTTLVAPSAPKHLVELVRTAIGADDHARPVTGEIDDFFGNKARAGCYRGIGERAIEHRAAQDEERTVGCGPRSISATCAAALTGLRPSRIVTTTCRQRVEVDDVADERERAAGQPAAARLLARMARIEQRDRRARARQPHRSHGARRSRADNGDYACQLVACSS